MITLIPAKEEELNEFIVMESNQDTAEFIIPYSLEQHTQAFADESIVYLSIYQEQTLSGFIILALESDHSVEFKRIVVSTKGQGIGQIAMKQMEQYCAGKLGCDRIWLDVFAENDRGLHIYQKLGFQLFNTSEFQGKSLLLMEKRLTKRR